MTKRGFMSHSARGRLPLVRRIASVCVVFAVLGAGLEAQQLYRSNPAGIEVEPIEEAERGRFDYVLEVREGDGMRERTLFADGEPLRRERYVTDGEGRVLREEHYDDVGEGLDPTYIDELAYDGEGRVRRVSRVRDGDVVRETRYAYAEGRLFEESFRNGNEVTVVRYDNAGRVAFRSERRDGEVLRRREYRYEDEGERVVTTYERNTTGVRVERFTEGRLVASWVELDGDVVSRTEREYEDGNLSRVITTGRDLPAARVEDYEYDEEGELVRRVIRSRERKVKEVVYSGDRAREEITYRDGKPFLRITYRDGNPVSRELVREE